MAQLYGPFILREFAVDGTVASGYYVKTFEPDGAYTALKSVYKDAGKVTPHPNPFQINSSGFPLNGKAYLDGAIDYKVYDGDPDADGDLVDTVPNAGDNFTAHATDLQNLILNASFETDTDSDGEPDNWTVAAHANHTCTRVTSDSSHGSASMKLEVNGSGSSFLTSAFFEVSNLDTLIGGMTIKSSHAGIHIRAQLIFHNGSQVDLNVDQIIFDSTANPSTFTAERFSSIVPGDASSSARFARLQLRINDNGQTGDVYVDNIWLKVRQQVAAGFIPSGLRISRDSGDTDHDINVTAGSVKADDGVYDLILDAETTKQMDASFAVGDDAGGAESGFSIPTEELVYIWLIGSSTTGAVDVLISNSSSSPSLPTDFDKKRRIFCWPTDSSGNLVAGLHDGIDKFYFYEVLLDVSDSTVTNLAYETGTFLCPPNGEYFFTCRLEAAGTDWWNEGFIHTKTTAATNGEAVVGAESSSQSLDELRGRGWEQVDANSQFDYMVRYAGTVNPTVSFYAQAYRDVERNLI